MDYTSGVNITVGATLHSLALKRFPALTNLSLKWTEICTEGLNVSGTTGEGRSAALDRDAMRVDTSASDAIVFAEKVFWRARLTFF